MNRRTTRTLAAVVAAIILVAIGLVVANRSSNTGTTLEPTITAPQPASATVAQPASATVAQPASASPVLPVRATIAPPNTTSQSANTAVVPPVGTSAAQQGTYPVSADQASTNALADSPGATITGAPMLVSYQGAIVYEVTLDTGMVYVDATSGLVVASTATNSVTNRAQGGGNGGGGEHEGGEDGEHEGGEGR